MSSGPGAMYVVFQEREGQSVRQAVSAGAKLLSQAKGITYREAWMQIAADYRIKKQEDAAKQQAIIDYFKD